MSTIDDPRSKKQRERRQQVEQLRTLSRVLDNLYFFRKSNSIQSDKTHKQYRIAVRHYSQHLGHEATIDDLDDDSVMAWQVALLASGQANATVREKVGRVTALWNWLYRGGYFPYGPTVDKPPLRSEEPQAWTHDELQRLFDAAGREDGWIEGIRAGDWWSAWFAFLWATGERYGATKDLRWEWVDLIKRHVHIPAHARKGRAKSAHYGLPEYAVAALQKIQEPVRDLVFPWPFCEGSYYYRFRRILKRAGLPHDRRRKTHAIRVSHATWTKALGGDASRALLHSSPATTEKHYIDGRIAKDNPDNLPPPWELTAGG